MLLSVIKKKSREREEHGDGDVLDGALLLIGR